MFNRITATNDKSSTVLIRSMVGFIFFTEGLQKFLFPHIRGAGRFEEMGLPVPEFLSYFVASFEVLCGALILLGLLTRIAAVPIIFIMLSAIILTKLPILVEENFWVMVYISKIDMAMLIGSLFLLMEGGGRWSLDRRFFSSRSSM
ncbi:MAG: DoxX family protein [Balneolaceae bacterium]